MESRGRSRYRQEKLIRIVLRPAVHFSANVGIVPIDEAETAPTLPRCGASQAQDPLTAVARCGPSAFSNAGAPMGVACPIQTSGRMGRF